MKTKKIVKSVYFTKKNLEAIEFFAEKMELSFSEAVNEMVSYYGA